MDLSKRILNNQKKILKEIRLTKGLSQVEMASILNIAQATYSRTEMGQTEILASRWLLICKLFDVDPSILLSGTSNKL